MENQPNEQLLKETHHNLSEINKGLHTIAKAIGMQQVLIIRMLAAQASNFAVIRSYIIEGDAQNDLAARENKKFFLKACSEFQKQLVLLEQSQDAMKFLNSFSDEEMREAKENN